MQMPVLLTKLLGWGVGRRRIKGCHLQGHQLTISIAAKFKKLNPASSLAKDPNSDKIHECILVGSPQRRILIHLFAPNNIHSKDTDDDN